MKRISEHIYENQDILLDHIHWQACTFKNCRFETKTGIFKIDLCIIDGCSMKVGTGTPAYNMLSLLEMIYPGKLPFQNERPKPGEFK